MYLPSYDPHARHRKLQSVAPAWFLGLDLGQRRDHTALAILERVPIGLGRCPSTYEWQWDCYFHLHTLERFPLHTSYTEVPDIVAHHITRIEAMPYNIPVQLSYSAAPPVHLIVDAGGPGGPMVDLLRQSRLRAALTPVLITAAAAPSRLPGGFHGIPRRNLITNLTLLIDNAKLKAPTHLHHWPNLVEELLTLNADNTHPANSTAHDDLVLALSLAAWTAAHD